ncbi:MAG: RAD55 family ATPase [Nitrososphaeria archaeon]
MPMPNYRTPTEILPTRGYVTVLEGEPGIGKTTLALASALAAGKAKYISYNEPEESLRNKAQRVMHRMPENLEVAHMLSGSTQRTFTEIINAMSEGKIVILDSVDAFLWGEADQKPERALLQLIYESVKVRSGSLILINEGISGLSNMLKFVVDAYIRMETENLLGINVRKISVKKDRDYPVSIHPFYYTFHDGLQVFSSSYFLDLDAARQKKVKPWERPFGSKSIMNAPELFLYILDSSVSIPFSRLYRYWLAVDYLNRKYSIAFVARPDEDAEKLKESICAMAGTKAGLNVVKSSGNIAEDRKMLMSFSGAMIIADIIVWEHEASFNPSAYESAIKDLVMNNLSQGSGMVLFSYRAYRGLDITEKYATRERVIVEKENHIFLRTVRPPGPLYYVSIENPQEPELRLITMF